MDLQPGWPSQTTQEQSPAPLSDDAFDPWKQTEEPESFSNIPSGSGGSASRQQDALGDYLLTSGSSYPSLLTKTIDPSQTTPTKSEPHDSGFVSRSGSYTGRPSLDLVVPAPTLRSGTQSPTNESSSTRSPTHSKRRNSPVEDIKPSPTDPTPFKKPRKAKSSAHNDVEKRYRTNLNIKIAELSASVPSLRAAASSADISGDEIDMESKPGYPARGLKKATILSRATEYIKTLEGERRSLEEENRTLRKRLMLCGRIAGEEGLK